MTLPNNFSEELAAFGETICRRVGVAYHCVAPPHPHQSDGVCVYPRHEYIRALPCTEGARADVRLGEPDRRAFCSDDGSGGCRGVVPLGLLPLGAFLIT